MQSVSNGRLQMALQLVKPAPMDLSIIGKAVDQRTNTQVVYALISASGYLALVGDDFESFGIQRRREKHRAYERMRQDIVEGALLPTITLAVKPELVPEVLPIIQNGTQEEIISVLGRPNSVSILDGLQRTHILSDLRQAGHEFKAGQTIHLEFWLEKEIKHLIYRIIVLNAGQKPMSMRHQIELLFLTLKSKLEQQISSFEIYTERDATRRRKSRKFALDRLAAAYQCFITRSPELDRENLVAQKLIDNDVLDSSEAELSSQFDSFVGSLSRYADLDDEVFRVYPSGDENESLKTSGLQWFGSENVMNSFFAALGSSVGESVKEERAQTAIAKLHSELQAAQPGSDPLNLSDVVAIVDGFNPRKVNVGYATRRLLTAAFKDFFRDSGETPLGQCWKLAAE